MEQRSEGTNRHATVKKFRRCMTFFSNVKINQNSPCGEGFTVLESKRYLNENYHVSHKRNPEDSKYLNSEWKIYKCPYKTRVMAN